MTGGPTGPTSAAAGAAAAALAPDGASPTTSRTSAGLGDDDGSAEHSQPTFDGRADVGRPGAQEEPHLGDFAGPPQGCGGRVAVEVGGQVRDDGELGTPWQSQAGGVGRGRHRVGPEEACDPLPHVGRLVDRPTVGRHERRAVVGQDEHRLPTLGPQMRRPGDRELDVLVETWQRAHPQTRGHRRRQVQRDDRPLGRHRRVSRGHRGARPGHGVLDGRGCGQAFVQRAREGDRGVIGDRGAHRDDGRDAGAHQRRAGAGERVPRIGRRPVARVQHDEAQRGCSGEHVGEGVDRPKDQASLSVEQGEGGPAVRRERAVADVVEDVRLGGRQSGANAVERGVLEDVDGHRGAGGKRSQAGCDQLPLPLHVECSRADRRGDGDQHANALVGAGRRFAHRRLGGPHDRGASIEGEEAVGLGVIKQFPRQDVGAPLEPQHESEAGTGRRRVRDAGPEAHQHRVGHQGREQRGAHRGVVRCRFALRATIRVHVRVGRCCGHRGQLAASPSPVARRPVACDRGPTRRHGTGFPRRRAQHAHVEVVTAAREGDVEVKVRPCAHRLPFLTASRVARAMQQHGGIHPEVGGRGAQPMSSSGETRPLSARSRSRVTVRSRTAHGSMVLT